MTGIARLRTTAELAKLGSFAPHFVELAVGAEWLTEVASLAQARHGALRTYLQRALRLYVSDFDANAWAGTYRMLLLPQGSWRELCGEGFAGRLLDVGAGSGDVTVTLAPHFAEVETTELSRGMARKLTRRGFRCHAFDLATRAAEPADFDVVTLLNVLDRCPKPRTLLASALAALAPGGLLVVALALPYRPFYFTGAATPEPLERLDCEAEAWEDGARRLIERELLPLGLELVTLARAPYLSAGDSARAIYELDDVLVVARKPRLGSGAASEPKMAGAVEPRAGLASSAARD